MFTKTEVRVSYESSVIWVDGRC